MARYDTLRKASRNRAIVAYRKENPELSLKEIGQVFGITGQRVYYILKKSNGSQPTQR